MSDLQNLPHLLEIAKRALAADAQVAGLKVTRARLSQAYQRWKDEGGHEHIERGSEQWAAMLEATKYEYEALRLARRAAYNAKRALANAVRRYRQIDVDQTP